MRGSEECRAPSWEVLRPEEEAVSVAWRGEAACPRNAISWPAVRGGGVNAGTEEALHCSLADHVLYDPQTKGPLMENL